MANLFQIFQQAAYDPNVLLTQVALPFMLIFVIIWGALLLTKIFGYTPEARKIYIVIALVITMFAAFTDAWGLVATSLAVFSGVFAYVMFFAVFIIGTIIWAIGRTRSIHYAHSPSGRLQEMKNMKQINKELDKLYRKYKEAEMRGELERAGSYGRAIEQLEKKREDIIRRPSR